MPQAVPAVSIVIPVYNNWALTRACLESLKAQLSGESFEVLVVDNGSTDETKAACPGLGRALFGERFALVDPGRNLGFAAGCNLGARAARGGLLFFLNNDTVAGNDFLPPLIETLAEDDRLAGVGPLLLYPGNLRVQHLGVAVPCGLEGQHLYEYLPGGHPLARRKRRFQVITAAALLLPKALFLEEGGFCEEFRNGYEDVDLCCRLTRRGLSFTCEPAAVVQHLASKSQGRFDNEARNSGLLVRRCAGCFAPDMDLLLAADGYDLALTEWFLPHPVLRPGRAAELAARLAAMKDPGGILDLIEEEPYWNTGYEAITSLLEGEGLWQDSAELRYWQGVCCPSLANYRKLLHAARQAGDREREAAAQGILALLDWSGEEWARRLALVEGYVRQARAAGNDRLARLFADWLAARRANPPAGTGAAP
jgi:GT2 family glycosyltransferase